jgi:hypothetical protein
MAGSDSWLSQLVSDGSRLFAYPWYPHVLFKEIS